MTTAAQSEVASQESGIDIGATRGRLLSLKTTCACPAIYLRRTSFRKRDRK